MVEHITLVSLGALPGSINTHTRVFYQSLVRHKLMAQVPAALKISQMV